MNTATLVIKDFTNVKFEGLDPVTRRKLNEALKFMVPYARHVPSFKMGRWDGKVSFATMGGGTYFNLLELALPIVMDAGYEIEIDDHRPKFNFQFPEVNEAMFAHKVWPEGHPMAGEPIMLRDYQARAIKTFTENLQSIQNISTGAGKTITTAALSAVIEPYGRTLVIVPNRSLVEQTEEDYRNLGLDVGVIYGGRHEYGHAHTIATWQSLTSKSKKDAVDFSQLVDGVVCVIVDEVHTAKGNELKELLTTHLAHVPIRWGFTGTVPKEDHEFLCILAALGPVVGEVRAKELQDKGVLANCDIKIIQMVEDHIEFKDYHSEHNYLMTDETRLKWIAQYADGLEGNVLVLVDRIETGKVLEDMIPESVFVSGTTKTKDRRVQYKAIEEGGKARLIATSGVAAVGISITYIDHVVYISYGKSFTKSIQTVGRGLRRSETKTRVTIHDICSTMKYDKKHLNKRKEYYSEAQYPFSQVKKHYRF